MDYLLTGFTGYHTNSVNTIYVYVPWTSQVQHSLIALYLGIMLCRVAGNSAQNRSGRKFTRQLTFGDLIYTD